MPWHNSSGIDFLLHKDDFMTSARLKEVKKSGRH